MTAEEIARSYRTAKNPNGQIKILADLCCCKRSTIAQILIDAGCEVDKRFLSGGNVEAKKAKAAAAEMPPVSELDTAPAPKPDAAPEPEPLRLIEAEPEPAHPRDPAAALTLADLRAILDDVDGGAELLLMDGRPLTGLRVEATFGRTLERERLAVVLLTEAAG